MHDCRCLQRSEESVGSSRSGVTGGCESSDMGARERTQLFYDIEWSS